MKKRPLAAAAISLLAAATAIVLFVLFRGSPGGGGSTPPRSDAGAPGPPAAPPAVGPMPAGTAALPEGGPAAWIAPASGPEGGSAPPPAPEDADASWRESPVASRVRQLGKVAPYVHAGLRDARREMSFCFRDATAAAAAEADVAPSPASLVLYLEAREGAIDVVEVRIDRLGSWPREVVECCREVLRGHEIPAPNAVRGRRWRLNHLLH